MKQKIIRSGKHSLAVVVPAPFVHSLGIKAGNDVDVSTNLERGVVNLRFHGAIQLPLYLKSSAKKPQRTRK